MIFFLLGLGLLASLIFREGPARLGTALQTVGWGVIAVALFHLLPLGSNTVAWRGLLIGQPRPHFLRLFCARWVGESINNTLPVAQVGGDFVRARWLASAGMSATAAGASVVVDYTLGILTHLIFALAGVALLLTQTGLADDVGIIFGGLVIFSMPVLILYLWQRSEVWIRVARTIGVGRRGGWRQRLLHEAGILHEDIGHLYRQHGRIARCASLKLLAWFVGAGEVLLILMWLGAPGGLSDALILESLGYAARSVAFMVPAGLGIQDGAFVFLAQALGLPASVGLAIAVVKRVRELLLGTPGLIYWLGWRVRRQQNGEGRSG